MVRGARGTGHQRLKEGVGESCPGRGHQRLKEGAGEACLAGECAPWMEKGREWKGNGGEEARKKLNKIYHQQTEIGQKKLEGALAAPRPFNAVASRRRAT